MKQGEIYLVNWDPSVGHEFQKSRPGVIISSTESLKDSNLVSLLPLTKNLQSPIMEDILIRKDVKNRLTADSLIKVQHTSCFDKRRVLNYIGEVSEDILKEIKFYLKKHFDL